MESREEELNQSNMGSMLALQFYQWVAPAHTISNNFSISTGFYYIGSMDRGPLTMEVRAYKARRIVDNSRCDSVTLEWMEINAKKDGNPCGQLKAINKRVEDLKEWENINRTR